MSFTVAYFDLSTPTDNPFEYFNPHSLDTCLSKSEVFLATDFDSGGISTFSSQSQVRLSFPKIGHLISGNRILIQMSHLTSDVV